jgi:hypothetical protein
LPLQQSQNVYFSSGTASNSRQLTRAAAVTDTRNPTSLATAANTAINTGGGTSSNKPNLTTAVPGGGPTAGGVGTGILQQSATTGNLGVRPGTSSKPYSSSAQR